MTDLQQQLMERYDAADRYLAQKRTKWGEYEDLFHNRLADQISAGTKSQVFEPILSTLSIDRSARVMAQLATGKVKPISNNDQGAAKLMNLALDKYIIPNANAQFDFLTKCRMVDLYSNMYGNFFVLVDWDVKPNGYIGPDMFLINIRDVFPQIGPVSVEDSDYIIIQSWQPISYFERIAKMDGVKNISTIVEKLKKRADQKQGRDTNHMSNREQQEYSASANGPAKGTGMFQVLSMYERDRWVDYVPAAEDDGIFRDIKNPHDDGELPVVNKYSIPLLDDFMAMGDYERGKSMQMAQNSLWNLYFDAIKISIFPPVMLNDKAIADSRSIKWSPAAKWKFNTQPGPNAQVMNLTPQGTNTFNNATQMVKASLLNQFGTTDTSVTKQADPGFGKTPEAIKAQSARENARDNVDRFYMEQFLTKVNKKFINLMSKMGDKVQFNMFEDEIDEIAKQHPEIADMYDPETGKLTIDTERTGSVVYDYEIVSGSTFAADQKEQQENLIGLLKQLTDKLTSDPMTGQVTSPMIAALKAENKRVNLGELFTRIVSNSGIQDWDKIIEDLNDDPDELLNGDAMKFMQALQGMGVEGIPAQPGGQPPMPMQGMPQGPAPTQQAPQLPPELMGGGMADGLG